METIKDSNDKVIRRSANLRGLLTYARTHLVSRISITPLMNGEGRLYVGFENGAYSESTFASFDVLQDWIVKRRVFRGTPIHCAIPQTQAIAIDAEGFNCEDPSVCE